MAEVQRKKKPSTRDRLEAFKQGTILTGYATRGAVREPGPRGRVVEVTSLDGRSPIVSNAGFTPKTALDHAYDYALVLVMQGREPKHAIVIAAHAYDLRPLSVASRITPEVVARYRGGRRAGGEHS